MKKKQLARKLLRRKTLYPLGEMIPDLENWFESPVGCELLTQQQKQLDEVLETLFGYHLMELGITRKADLSRASKIQHRFALSPLSGQRISGVTEDEQLPIATESVDVAVLHHVLDYSQKPHHLLKEVSRVVLPSGHVVIVGFNPYSLMGLWSMVSRARGIGAGQNHLLSISRLADWLTIMDFNVQTIQYGYYKPPVSSRITSKLDKLDALMQRFQLPFGGFYLLLAKKEVSRLTPIKTRWHHAGKPAIPSIEPGIYTHKLNKKDKLH